MQRAGDPFSGAKNLFDGRCSSPSDYIVTGSLEGEASHAGRVMGQTSHCTQITWTPQVTGERFSGFSSITTESPPANATVEFFPREGAMVVARFKGLQTGSSYWGYGRWASRSSVVVAGAIMLDRDFELSGSRSRRSLRVHEMGHTLGWDHVTLRTSFMNSNAVTEPNAFDRDATRLAYLRPPGNQAPDRDPSPYSVNLRAFPMLWGPMTP